MNNIHDRYDRYLWSTPPLYRFPSLPTCNSRTSSECTALEMSFLSSCLSWVQRPEETLHKTMVSTGSKGWKCSTDSWNQHWQSLTRKGWFLGEKFTPQRQGNPRRWSVHNSEGPCNLWATFTISNNLAELRVQTGLHPKSGNYEFFTV